MRQFLISLLVTTTFCHTLLGQKKDEVNFSDPFQIDSSEYFLVPQLVDNDDYPVYGRGKGYLPWGDYKDIHFYNSKTGKSKKLFEGQRVLIQTFTKRYNYYDQIQAPQIPSNILANHIVYLVRTDNFNGDNALDSDDPLYLYISGKNGENLTQITPKGLNVISWTISKDKKMILVKGQNDKNNNKKFGQGDDQLYYRIDLNDDITKIQCYRVEI